MWAPVRQAVVSVCGGAALLWGSAGVAQTTGTHIPAGPVTTLVNRTVTLPRELPGHATVLILGFGRHSKDATTAWEKPVRMQLAQPPTIRFFDMAMLAEVPGFVRPMVIRLVRKAVPDVLKPNFVVLVDREDEWKRFAGYVPDQPEAAYVLLVDSTGAVRWSTHDAFTPAGFAQLTQATKQLAGEKP